MSIATKCVAVSMNAIEILIKATFPGGLLAMDTQNLGRKVGF